MMLKRKEENLFLLKKMENKSNFYNTVECPTCGKKLTIKSNWYKLSGRKELFCKLECLEKWEAKNGLRRVP